MGIQNCQAFSLGSCSLETEVRNSKRYILPTNQKLFRRFPFPVHSTSFFSSSSNLVQNKVKKNHERRAIHILSCSRSMLLYVHRDHRDYNYYGRELRTATSTFTQLLSSKLRFSCFALICHDLVFTGRYNMNNHHCQWLGTAGRFQSLYTLLCRNHAIRTSGNYHRYNYPTTCISVYTPYSTLCSSPDEKKRRKDVHVV